MLFAPRKVDAHGDADGPGPGFDVVPPSSRDEQEVPGKEGAREERRREVAVLGEEFGLRPRRNPQRPIHFVSAAAGSRGARSQKSGAPATRAAAPSQPSRR